MTAATITLNVGTGGDKPLVDTLSTVDGAAAPAGASTQMVKIGHGAASDFKTASQANPLPTVAFGNSLVSTANSSTTVLAANAVLTGTSEDISEFAHIIVSLFASHVSATDGVQLQQSLDGTNWDLIDAYTLPAATGKTFSAPVQGKFFRIVFTNGAILQTTFRLQTIFSKQTKKGSSVRPQDGRSNENDFDEVLAYGMGYNGASWDRLRSTIANGLVVDVSRIIATVAVAGTRSNAGTAPVAGSLHLTVGGSDGTNLRPMSTDTTGRLNVNAITNATQLAGVAIAAGSGVVTAGTQRIVLATDVIQPAVSELRAATLHISVTAAVNTALTASLPAPAAGLFHYITSVQLVKVYNVLGVAAGAGVVITSTNLPGTPNWTTEQAAGAIGTAPLVINYQPTTPLKASAAAVATTFVAPAQLQTIWRWNVSYFTAA